MFTGTGYLQWALRHCLNFQDWNEQSLFLIAVASRHGRHQEGPLSTLPDAKERLWKSVGWLYTGAEDLETKGMKKADIQHYFDAGTHNVLHPF